MEDNSFDVFCPTCNILVEVKTLCSGEDQDNLDLNSSISLIDSNYEYREYTVGICSRCKSPFFKQSIFLVYGSEFVNLSEERILFPSPPNTLLGNLPNSVDRAFTQASKCYKSGFYDASVLMCRRALEATCKSLGATGKNLFQKIVDLKNKGHIDLKLNEWADSVRMVGNKAAHEVEKAISKEDAQDILDFTEALLLYTFTLDTKFQAFQQRNNKTQ